MKKLIIVISIVLLSVGCSTRMVDFTVISSKNIDMSQSANFVRSKVRVKGEDRKSIIIFIPTGVPDAKEALDRAIEGTPNAVALTDGVMTQYWWYIPYIFGQSWIEVEGTPLLDLSK